MNFTTKTDLANGINAALAKKVPFPDGRIVDVEILDSDNVSGNTALVLTLDMFAGKPVPANWPDSARYQPHTKYINRIDIGTLPGAKTDAGGVLMTTYDPAVTNTTQLVDFINKTLDLALTADQIVAAPIPKMNVAIQVQFTIVPTDLNYKGSITVSIYPVVATDTSATAGGNTGAAGTTGGSTTGTETGSTEGGTSGTETTTTPESGPTGAEGGTSESTAPDAGETTTTEAPVQPA